MNSLESFKKPYEPPAVVYETNLEVRAGSPSSKTLKDEERARIERAKRSSPISEQVAQEVAARGGTASQARDEAYQRSLQSVRENRRGVVTPEDEAGARRVALAAQARFIELRNRRK